MPNTPFSFEDTLKYQSILIVENEADDREAYRNFAETLGMLTLTARDLDEAIRLAASRPIDHLLCDLHLSTKAEIDSPDGLDVISHVRAEHPNAIIVAMSSDPRRDVGDRAISAGAQHFVRKPMPTLEDFKVALRLAQQRFNLARSYANDSDWKNPNPLLRKYPEGIVISDETRRVLKKIASRRDIQLNLYGETGTGKEEIARLFHRIRSSIEGPIPFVTVNCAQLNPSIADSQLFGHRKGSFTGASENTIGYVGKAHGGILFLDEIHSLQPDVQLKLLRVLNDGTYTRVGDTQEKQVQFFLITASTKDLDEEALAGRFAMDLKMRIEGYLLKLAPLRERLDILKDLLTIALARQNKSLSDQKVDEVATYLSKFYWAGNIRQFFKVVNSWILHCEIYELPLDVAHIPVSKSMLMPGFDMPTVGNEVLDPQHQQSIDLLKKALTRDMGLESTLEGLERSLIQSAISRHATLGDAMKALGLPRSTFDARRRKLGLLT